MELSIVICSRNENLPEALLDNIRNTIGSCDFEIVAIDNHDGHCNIFQAYNDGVERSSGDILCFMHDDISFLSDRWGERVVSALEPSDVGACAVAGCKVLRKAPSLLGIGKYNAINVQQPDGTWLDRYSEPTLLATFDGLWFCIKRSCFDRIRFDDVTYDGFHFYDMDTAIQLHRAGYKIAFVPEIQIRHESNGCTNVSWLESSYKCYQKNKNELPIFATNERPDAKEMMQFEMDVIYTSLRLIARYRRWHLLGQWWQMASEVLQVKQPKAVWMVLRNHFKKKKA